MARLPEVTDRNQLPEQSRHILDDMVRTRGKVLTSYATMFHAPEVVARVLHLGTYMRFESSLPKPMIALLALTTSAELDNTYERANHAASAASLGIPAAVVDAITAKNALPPAGDDITMPVACARDIARTHALSDANFEAAHRALGDRGAVDLIATVGFYAMLACIHNALQIRLPQA